ncbi:hypothetical protein [Micromonospora sp. NBRC 101691]|uniref:hypothetical protein n=1 Tax=Micromonospora sp. NBRC 101691 TaxID=3032198 RepID=UPI0024A15C70|nr:hypothetical protein [Micromonospora sp. NBRC 101691]GLY22589.1 hypothetical protein Misp04_23210 [Micromonospora sp. NBRC 101691]
MTEPAKKVAQQAEERLDRVAETVREKFDAITGSRFAGKPGRAVERRSTAEGDRAGPDRTAPRPGPGGKGRKHGAGT